MGKSKGGLGRDFYSLLDDNSFESKGPVTKLALKDIQARRDQPRKDFDMNALQLLADSIREQVAALIAQGIEKKAAIKQVAQRMGVPKNDVYMEVTDL